MEKLTEYEWEQRKRERQRIVDFRIAAGKIAYTDLESYEVDFVCEAYPRWHDVEAQRKMDGWELAPYGQESNFFIHSGYFRRKKPIPPSELESSPANP